MERKNNFRPICFVKYLIRLTVLSLFFAFGCSSDDALPAQNTNPPPVTDPPPGQATVIPTVRTYSATNLESVSAKISLQLMNTGWPHVNEMGIVFNTTGNPDIQSENRVILTSVNFNILNYLLSNLQANTTYYVRAYAKNTAGIGYGDLITFTTLDATLMIKKHLLSQVWADTVNDVVYFEGSDGNDNTTDTPATLYAYSYQTNQIIASKELNLYGFNTEETHDSGYHNNNFEIYYARGTKIEFLDRILNKFNEINTGQNISCIKREGDFLFVGGNTSIQVFDRNTLQLVSQVESSLNSVMIRPYYQSTTNTLRCLAFNRFSSHPACREHVFSASGVYLSTGSYGTPPSSHSLMRTNNNASVVLKGYKGDVYHKSSPLLPQGSITDDLTKYSDCAMSADGNTLYAVGYNNFVPKIYKYVFSGNTYVLQQSITVSIPVKKIIYDGNQLLVIGYNYHMGQPGHLYYKKFDLF
jgi:hypothetical protein